MQKAEVDIANVVVAIGDDARLFEKLYENFLPELYVFHLKSFTFIVANHAVHLNAGNPERQLFSRLPMDPEQEFDMKTLQNLHDTLCKGEYEQTIFTAYIGSREGTLFPADAGFQLSSYPGEEYRKAMVFDLSKCKEFESEIREKELTLDTVLDVARDAIVLMDDHGKVLFWNHAAEKIFGYSREEMIGKELHRFVTGDQQHDAYRKAFNIFQSTGKGNTVGKIIEQKAKCKDGREIDISLSVSALRIHDTWHAIGIARDISDRLQSNKALEESRQAYLALAENAPIGILTCDNQGNIQYINQMALDILGSPSLEETKRINLLSFPSLVKFGFADLLSQCLRENLSMTQEMNYVSKWGKQVWMRIHVKPQLKEGRVSGVQIIIDDITKTKQLEEKLLHLSVTDELTDAYNRRYIISKIEEQIDRFQEGSRFSVIMMDIDHFKNINDCFGHNAGDWVLKQITAELVEKIRKSDVLARWGGDEFMLLLPEADTTQAATVAEKLRVSLSRMDFSGVGQVTASFGVVGCSSVDNVDAIAQIADHMMYKAKFAGRNCVRCTEK